MKKNLSVLSIVLVLFLSPLLLQSQEQYLMLGPSDMLPYMDDNDYSHSGVELYSENVATHRYFYAPIHLPDGVRLKRVILFYYDDHGGNIQLDVYRENLYTGATNTICTWSSAGTSTSRQIQTIGANWTYNLISNGGYTYFLKIYFTDSTAGNATRFFAAKIVYQ
jgi:hypothetical protein